MWLRIVLPRLFLWGITMTSLPSVCDISVVPSKFSFYVCHDVKFNETGKNSTSWLMRKYKLAMVGVYKANGYVVINASSMCRSEHPFIMVNGHCLPHYARAVRVSDCWHPDIFVVYSQNIKLSQKHHFMKYVLRMVYGLMTNKLYSLFICLWNIPYVTASWTVGKKRDLGTRV